MFGDSEVILGESSSKVMGSPLVSVIVPVYEVESYLRECVDSILAQSYKHIEIILVDDGSTDGSGAICDECASQDTRVVSLHKENGGLSDARNYGLRHAHGEWISFIDSDDFVSSVFLEELLAAAESCGVDIVAVPYGTEFHDGEIPNIEGIKSKGAQCVARHSKEQHDAPLVLPEPLAVRDYLRRLLYQDVDTGAPWRLYRRWVLGENPFPVGIYYEDLACMYRIVERAGMVVMLDRRDLYAYRMRNASIIRQPFSPLKAVSAVAVANQLHRDISEWHPDLSVAASSRAFSVCRMVYGQTPRSETEYRKMLWKVLSRHRDVVLRDPCARKRERLASAVAYLGPNVFAAFCLVCRKTGLMR